MICHRIKQEVEQVFNPSTFRYKATPLFFFQVINKANDSYFDKNDEKVFEKYLQFCGIGLRQGGQKGSHSQDCVQSNDRNWSMLQEACFV